MLQQKSNYKIIEQCRVGGSGSLKKLINYGDQPLANSLKSKRDEKENKIPLTLTYCEESSLVQLRETVNKEILFSNYIWLSGTASTTKRFAKEFAQRIIQVSNLRKNEFILEIASNDGTFLVPFKEMGFLNVLGIDPAENLKTIAEVSGIVTITAFWNKDVADDLVRKKGRAKIVIARNVLPHVSQLSDVIAGIKSVLREDGVAVIEFHYAGVILDELQYDSVYHEHLCYFSLKSISNLFAKYDLFPFHIDYSPISGGAVVLYVASLKNNPTQAYIDLSESEDYKEINSFKTWELFARRCLEHKELSKSIMQKFDGKRIIGFGASARSSTYLNFCEFTNDHFDGIIDNNILKQGKFAPGSSIPILSLDEGLLREPDLIFILAWNFREEIINLCRSQGYRGDYIVAFPNEPRVIKS